MDPKPDDPNAEDVDYTDELARYLAQMRNDIEALTKRVAQLEAQQGTKTFRLLSSPADAQITRDLTIKVTEPLEEPRENKSE
jgi:hypothetical protein